MRPEGEERPAALAREAASSCRVGAPGSLDGHEAFKPRGGAGRCVEHGRELLELVGVQTEKDLIQYHGLGAVAVRFEHEVRTVLAQQAGGVIDQITLLGQGDRK